MGVPPPGLVGGTWANKVRRRDLWISPEMCRVYPDAKWRAQRYKEREKIRREKSRRERARRKKIQMCERKESRETLFSNDLGLRGSKSRLVKRACAEPAGHMTDTPAVRSTFTPYQCRKWEKRVRSQHPQFLGSFWKLGCLSRKCTPLWRSQDCSVFQVICFEKERFLAEFPFFFIWSTRGHKERSFVG